MSGLRDRMNRLRGESSGQNRLNESDEAPVVTVDEVQTEDEETEWLSPVWETFGVKLHTNDTGSFLLRKIVYPISFRHGLHTIDELHAAAPGLTAFHSFKETTAQQILFLDLETTGLGSGTGNVPFMVGIGYMTNEQFVIEQTIIRHPAEERAMLVYLAEKLRSFTFLATYNGKSFDWPLVQNRFIMNGLGREIWQPQHLDFLHPARSVWRNTLASCRLSHVEEERLGIHREDDVPGSLAPQLYFQYLATGDPAPLEGVFRHNEIDMLSLACLAIRFGHLLNGNLREFIPLPTEPEEMVRTGLWLERMGNGKLSEQLFELAIAEEKVNSSTLHMLAMHDKKAGNWERAVLLWQKTIIHSNSYYSTAKQEAYVELAMYYEHKLKDYVTALQYATNALDSLLSYQQLERPDAKKRAELTSLKNRLMRLRRKAEKNNVLDSNIGTDIG